MVVAAWRRGQRWSYASWSGAAASVVGEVFRLRVSFRAGETGSQAPMASRGEIQGHLLRSEHPCVPRCQMHYFLLLLHRWVNAKIVESFCLDSGERTATLEIH